MIYINNNKDIKFFEQNLVDISLKVSWYVRKCKKHYMLLKVPKTRSSDRFLFIAFLDFFFIISICQIQLRKLFGLAKMIQQFAKEKQ